MNNIYCAAPREQYCAAPREQYILCCTPWTILCCTSWTIYIVLHLVNNIVLHPVNNIYCAAPREQYCAAPREQYCAAHREQYCQQSCSVMKTMYSYSIVQLSILLSIMIIITNKLLLSILRSHVPTTVNNCCCFINAEQHCWKNNEQHCLFDNVVQQNCLCKTAYQKKQKTQSVNARKLFYVNLFLACRKYQDTANFFFLQLWILLIYPITTRVSYMFVILISNQSQKRS